MGLNSRFKGLNRTTAESQWSGRDVTRDVIRDTGNSCVVAIYLCAVGLQLVMRRSGLETSHAVLHGNVAESPEDKHTGIQGTWRTLILSNTRRKRLVQARRRVNSVYSLARPLTVAGDCSELPAEQL